MCMMLMLQSGVKGGVKKVKEADLYSAFIEVPYTQLKALRRGLVRVTFLHFTTLHIFGLDEAIYNKFCTQKDYILLISKIYPKSRHSYDPFQNCGIPQCLRNG